MWIIEYYLDLHPVLSKSLKFENTGEIIAFCDEINFVKTHLLIQTEKVNGNI